MNIKEDVTRCDYYCHKVWKFDLTLNKLQIIRNWNEYFSTTNKVLTSEICQKLKE